MKKILSTFALLLILFSAGCISTTPEEAEEIFPLDENETEALEYDGLDLTPIDDQRNNAIKGTQYLYPDYYRLEITGMVNETITLTYNDIISYQPVSKAVPLDCVEGWGFAAKWTGVKMETLLNEAGIQEGATAVIFYSEDGYSTALDLDYLIDNNIIVAYKINDITLPPDRGFPLQLVAEGKYGYKWAKWIVKMEVVDDDYEGYWESRGYNNDADVGGPKFS